MSNGINRFAENPTKIDRPRGVFERPFDHKFDAPAGALIPFYLDEVMPGDSCKLETNCFVRMHTLALPPMDEIYCDVYYFFIPMRLVWSHTKQFFGEQDSPAWTENNSYSIPALGSTGANSALGLSQKTHNLMSYLGVNVGYKDDDWKSGSTTYNTYILRDLQKVSVLPVRCYELVHHTWFRDENYMAASGPSLGDSLASTDYNLPYGFTNLSASKNVFQDDSFYPVGSLFDYFTSVLPGPQFGPAVTIPAGNGYLPVVTRSVSAIPAGVTPYEPLYWTRKGVAAPSRPGAGSIGSNVAGKAVYGGSTAPGGDEVVPENLWANLDSAATAVGATVNQIRWAFAVQKYFEADSRGGAHRYHEIIKSHFGVTNPDARMQIPEYLGGKRFVLNQDTVLSTAETSTGSVGDIAGYSKTFDKVDGFTKSFTEYGYVMGVCCFRPKKTYFQGINPLFMRSEKFDFYWPEFAYLGEQEVNASEIFAGSNLGRGVFGYQEFGAEYRYKPNQLSGSFRPTAQDNSLSGFTFAHTLADSTNMAANARVVDYQDVSNALTVTTNKYPFICDFRVNGTWTRPMPVYSIPGLVDHY